MQTVALTNLQRVLHPLLGISLFVLGNSYYTTLTTLKLYDLKNPPVIIGFVLTAYFFGLVGGAFLSRHVIHNYGHKKTFFSLVLIACLCVCIQMLFVNAYLWMVLRFVIGTMTGISVVVVESWIAWASDGAFRTRAFAIYTFFYYGMQSLSQFFFQLDNGNHSIQLLIIVGLIASSVIPIYKTDATVPLSNTKSTTQRVSELYELDRFGLLASFFSGTFYACLYTVLPLYLSMQEMSTASIGPIMMVALLGGAVLLYPISSLADQYDKAPFIAWISATCVLLSFVLLVSPLNLVFFSVIAFFLFGLAFVLYPISLSLTVERLEDAHMVDGASFVLFGFGLGALLGPSIASFLMQNYGSESYFYFLIFIGLSLCVSFPVWGQKNTKIKH